MNPFHIALLHFKHGTGYFVCELKWNKKLQNAICVRSRTVEGQLILISANSPQASERPCAEAAAAAEPLCPQQVGRGACHSPRNS